MDNEQTEPGLEHLWMRPDGTYFLWALQLKEDTQKVAAIKSAMGEAAEVDAEVLGLPSLELDDVVDFLAYELRRMLTSLREVLTEVAPDLVTGEQPFDLPAQLPRILERNLGQPEEVLQRLAEVGRCAFGLSVLMDFGPASERLAEVAGAELRDLFARHEEVAPPIEGARIERVRKEIRAELDSYAASRPPLSFDFSDLAKVPSS